MDDEILEHLKRQAAHPRKHAAFFSWHDRSTRGKSMVELDIVSTLIEAMSDRGVHLYFSPSIELGEWPDCWVKDGTGTDIPVEVTELVDVAVLPAGLPRPWEPADIIERIQARVSAKDRRSRGGRGTHDSLLVLHTDELYLE